MVHCTYTVAALTKSPDEANIWKEAHTVILMYTVNSYLSMWKISYSYLCEKYHARTCVKSIMLVPVWKVSYSYLCEKYHTRTSWKYHTRTSWKYHTRTCVKSIILVPVESIVCTLHFWEFEKLSKVTITLTYLFLFEKYPNLHFWYHYGTFFRSRSTSCIFLTVKTEGKYVASPHPRNIPSENRHKQQKKTWGLKHLFV